MYRGPRPNDWPMHRPPEDYSVIAEDARRARHFGDLTQSYPRRIMGEVAVRYRLPQHIEDLLSENEALKKTARESAERTAPTQTPYQKDSNRSPRK